MRNPILVLLFAGALPAQTVEPDAGAAASGRALARANNAFACDLHRALKNGEGNLFYSPYSITVALGMTRRGAAGATAEEMDKVLHTSGVGVMAFAALESAMAPRMVRSGRKREKVAAYERAVANALWGQVGMSFEKPFLASMRRDFGAPLERIDFRKAGAARRRINAWVAERTRDRIKGIVPEGLPSPDCRLALGNAIYFRAPWAKPFEERSTEPGAFTVTAKDRVRVPMMARTDRLPYAQDKTVQVVEIPYRGADTSMVLIVPQQRQGLAAIEAGLTGDRLSGWIGRLKPRAVALRMPKFEITLPLRLDRTLQRMGIRSAFGASADFSKMTRAEKLIIGAVLHKAFVAVDEKGTEAAAATIVLMKCGASPRMDEPILVTADHPFLFVIRHRETGCVLFMGRVRNPKA